MNEKEKITKLIPIIRFPQFEGSEAWEKKKFEKLLKIGSGRDYKHLSEGNIPVYGTGGYMLSVNEFLYDGISACIGRKGTIDKPMLLSGKFWTVDTLFYTHSFKDCLPEFVHLLFQNINWVKYNEAGGIPSLSKNIIYNIEVFIPREDEQQKIVSSIYSLDNFIASEVEKLDALKDHKKGLLQQLFPAQGEKVPELRFVEFELDGEWDYENGNELFKPISNKNHNSDLPILAVTQEQGAIPREIIDYHVTVSEKSIKNYKVVEVGDFIVSLRSFQGGIEYSSYLGLCSPAYIILRKTQDILNDFYCHYFKSFLFIQELNKNLEGIRDGKMVSYKQFSEILIPKPKKEEQQKIANCISSLDGVIATQSEKIEALKEHKKGLMQQMFPNLNDIEV